MALRWPLFNVHQAEWKVMADNPQEYERGVPTRKGEMTIYVPSRRLRRTRKGREESYNLQENMKQAKHKQGTLEDLQDQLHNRAGFTATSQDEWAMFGGAGAASASGSGGIINRLGYTAAGAKRSHEDSKSLKTLLEDMSGTPLESSGCSGVTPTAKAKGKAKPETPSAWTPAKREREEPPEGSKPAPVAVGEEDPSSSKKKGARKKMFDKAVWRTLAITQLQQLVAPLEPEVQLRTVTIVSRIVVIALSCSPCPSEYGFSL